MTAASVVVLIGAVGIHGLGAASHIEDEVETRVADALLGVGADWVTFDVDGQIVLLSGEAPSAEAMKQAEEAVRTAEGSGGILFGAVTSVQSKIFIAPPPPPPAPPIAIAMAPEPTAPVAAEAPQAEVIETESEQSVEELLAACQDESADILKAQPINFDSKSANVGAEELETLHAVAAAINQCPNVHVIVEGHSDASGGASRNKALSLERARSVAESLKRELSRRSTVEARGFGEERPLVSNKTPAGRARNRRIEIKLEMPSAERAE
mgnify:CR=1 FL=1